MSKILATIISLAVLALVVPILSNAARTDGAWNDRIGLYLEVVWPEGRNILIRGINKYINFGTLSGTSGYGIRDNNGTIECKDSGGSWSPCQDGNGATGSYPDYLSQVGDVSTTSLDTYDLLWYDGVNWSPVATTSLGITAGSGVTDHGLLTGLLDNDHPQYFLLSDWYSTTTSDLAEGTNLYYTDARVGTYISGSSTVPHVGGTANGDILKWTGSAWTTMATSGIGYLWGNLGNIPAGFADGVDDTGGTLSGGSTNVLTYWTSGSTVGATSSPTVGYITATTTTASRLPFASSTGITATNFWGSLIGNVTGNVSGTAGSLASNGGNCTAGNFPLGVDASGAVETCTDAWTEAENTSAAYINSSALTPYLTLSAFYSTTTSDIGEGTNLYYTDARVNSYVHGSTTIPKTYTANTFTGLQTISNASTTHLSVTGNSYLDTVRSGTWNGTAIGDTYLTKTGDWTGQIDGNNFAGGAIGAGQLIYGGSAGSFSELTLGASSTVLTTDGTSPRWLAGSALCVAITGSADLCDGSDATGAGSSPWTDGGSFIFPTSGETVNMLSLNASSSATSTIGNLAGVFDASTFTGADIGAKVNAAYAALPPIGGTIYIPRGTYSFSTEIDITTSGKPALIQCEPGGATRLTYTGTTGTSTTFDVDWSDAPANQEWGMGIEGCWFYGEDNGYANIGLEVGGANGGQGFRLADTRWYTFGTGLYLGDNTYVANFKHNIWNWNGTNVRMKDAPNNSGESVWFENNLFEGYGTFGADCVDTGSYWTTVQFNNNSFDDCGVRVGAYSMEMQFDGNHFESSSGDDTEQYTFITIDASTGGESSVYITNNGFYQSKNTTRPSAYIDNNGATAVIENNAVISNTYPLDNFVDCEPAGAYCELRNNSLSANAITTVIDDLYAQSTSQYFGFDFLQVKDGGTIFGWSQDTSGNFEWSWAGTVVATSSSNGNWRFEVGTTTISRLDVTTSFDFLGDYITNVATWFTTRLQAVTTAVLTGTWDFGGATFLEIPNGTGPTADDPGEIAHDTTDNQLILDDYVIARGVQKIWSTTVASTSPAFISGGLLPVPTDIDGYTITRIQCHVTGGTSKVVALEDASANSSEDITCATTNTTDDGSITNATYTASELSYIDFGATSGSVNYVTVSVFGTLTRE